jgi:hypothetical protein
MPLLIFIFCVWKIGFWATMFWMIMPFVALFAILVIIGMVGTLFVLIVELLNKLVGG